MPSFQGSAGGSYSAARERAAQAPQAYMTAVSITLQSASRGASTMLPASASFGLVAEHHRAEPRVWTAAAAT